MPSWPCIGNRIFSSDVVQTGAICPAGVGSQDAKSKLREIAEKRAEDVEEVMLHLEKTLACLDVRYGQWKNAEIVMEHVGSAWNMLELGARLMLEGFYDVFFFSKFRNQSLAYHDGNPGCRTSHPPLFASWPRPSWMVARRRVRCLKR